MNLRFLLTVAVLASALALSGCATNPVTGKADVVTMSAAQEAESAGAAAVRPLRG
mgnify:CR=1 FL=1